jgi:DNA mismatch repair protein MutL
MPIRILDPTVAAQIAAGEVVERPASVIKELIENSLDAGAQRIHVESRGGGLQELKVQDDGRGIPSDEVELAFTRHATSKLQTADDLWDIATLGFRGEALPSIASVAQVVCTTRTAGEEVGTELRIAGGEVQSRTPRGCSPGTSISVRHLFYNTPVRRDYLRSASTEMSAISMVVQNYAMAYPEIRFTLLLDGRLALQTGGSGDLRDVVIEAYGLDVARQMLVVEGEYGEETEAVRVRGLISPPGLTRSSRNYFHMFVNRRAIQPRNILAYVVEEAYHTLLMKGRHPLVVLDMRVHPNAVDVNVHPTKSEVRFRHQSRVTSVLGRAVREALLEGAGVQPWDDTTTDPEGVPRRFEVRQTETERRPGSSSPSSSPSSAWGVGKGIWSVRHSHWDVGGGAGASGFPGEETESEASSPGVPLGTEGEGSADRGVSGEGEPGSAEPQTHASQTDTDTDRDDEAQLSLPIPSASPAPPPGTSSPPAHQQPAESRLPPLRVVGQVGLTYIVAESPDGLYLIDQHAVHERISYERLMRQRGSGAIDAQELLMPAVVEVPPPAAETLLGSAEVLEPWGFVLEPWGEGLVRVRAVPSLLSLEHLQSSLLEVVDHLGGEGGSTPDDWREAMLITLACHTSVRAGQALSLEEMRDLLRQLEQCQNPRTCPHGRPTMVLLTPGQLERQFGRQA